LAATKPVQQSTNIMMAKPHLRTVLEMLVPAQRMKMKRNLTRLSPHCHQIHQVIKKRVMPKSSRSKTSMTNMMHRRNKTRPIKMLKTRLKLMMLWTKVELKRLTM